MRTHFQDGLPVAAFIKARIAAALMPSELTSKDQFKELLKEAVEVRVVRRDESAKVKVRTKSGLHTFKTTRAEADTLVKGLKVPIVEL